MFGDWKLSYEGTNYLFGTPEYPVQVVEWEQAPDIYHDEDAVNPRSDGISSGQDFIEPGEITVYVKIDFSKAPFPVEECVRLAMQARAQLAIAWRADTVRNTNRAVAELTIGGEYIIEGRSRRAKFHDDDQNIGLIFAELPFVPSRPGAYLVGENDGWNQASLELVPAQVGGLKAPLRAPLRTSLESTRATTVTVGGETDAWGVYDLRGPIQSDAQIEIPGRWRLYLNRALGQYQTATIDTRPGHLGTRLNGVARQLLDPRSSLLGDCSLLPGQNVVALRGASIEGTASVTVRWRNMKASI